MFTLAEISDKMPSASQMWGLGAALSIPLIGVALCHRWAAAGELPLALALSAFLAFAAYHEAYCEGSFSHAIWTELGGNWVLHSIASALLPGMTVLSIASIHWFRYHSTDLAPRN